MLGSWCRPGVRTRGGEPQGETAGEALDDTAEDVYWLPHAKVTGDLSEQTDARQ